MTKAAGRLWLVRHGRPLVDRAAPAHRWPLDPAYADDVRALRVQLPVQARWFSSPEPKAVGTARLLTGEDVTVVDDLREHERHSTDWIREFRGGRAAVLLQPEVPAHPGWEPLAACRDRVVGAAATIRAAYLEEELVLVGHGTAWTVLAADLTGSAPDLDRWERLAMPDLLVLGAGPRPGQWSLVG